VAHASDSENFLIKSQERGLLYNKHETRIEKAILDSYTRVQIKARIAELQTEFHGNGDVR
jgi:hypothetical protein